jgi:pimeloyl-ACP methyl ester carboxylesterase
MVIRAIRQETMASTTGIQPAKLLSKNSYIAPKSLHVTEFFFQVPLDHSKPHDKTITLFANCVTKHISGTGDSSSDPPKRYLVYLQGGPGFGNAAPQDHPLTATALDKGYQLLLLDHRGTGLSTPVSARMLEALGDVDAQVEYMKLMRQDNTVRDCEAVRKCLTENWPENLKAWALHGQSYGGWISFSYLSMHPEGLKEVFLTGGIPPVGVHIDDVLKKTFSKVTKRNKVYFNKFPQDQDALKQIVKHIEDEGGELALPAGGTLTTPRLMNLGYSLGFHGGIDSIHSTILSLKASLDQFGFLSRACLSSLEAVMSFDTNIIYAVIHEAIYCDGAVASDWSAQRVGSQMLGYWWLREDRAKQEPDEPLYFSGEHVFPFFFDTYDELRSLKQVAEKLAKKNDWPRLYDEQKLRDNKVPVYAASYIEDLYVDHDLASATAKMVKNLKVYETNMLYHDAVRSKTDEVLPKLFALRDEVID